MAASPHRCVICRAIMPPTRKGRATCGDDACYSIYKSQLAQAAVDSGRVKVLNRQNWTTELRPWPDGIKFTSVDEGEPTYFTEGPPETHVPYGGSASWAVR